MTRSRRASGTDHGAGACASGRRGTRARERQPRGARRAAEPDRPGGRGGGVLRRASGPALRSRLRVRGTRAGEAAWSGRSAAGSVSPANGGMAERARARARSSPRCRRAPIPQSRRRSGSRGSPAGCRSRGVRRSGRTTACSCSARPERVGQVAVQAAKLLGAGHVVAAGRDPSGLERALELGADEAVGARRRLRRADLRLRPALGRAARAGRRRCGARSPDRPARPVGRADCDAAVGRDPGQAARRATASRTSASPPTCWWSTTAGWSGTRSPARSELDVERIGLDELERGLGAAPASTSSCP